jgi:DNA-binding transcriptional ArsR family regulator
MSPARSSVAPADPAPIFAALGDATRLKLIARLNDGRDLSIAQLADGLNLTRQGVTKHLRVLERSGIVRSSSVGRESRFIYVPEPIEHARSYLDNVSMQWDEALSRLKAFVEDGTASRTKATRRHRPRKRGR